MELPSARNPTGVLGIVSGIDAGRHRTHVVHLRPAALSEVFSSLHVRAEGTLATAAATASARPAGVGALSPRFSCSGPAPPPHVDVDLTAMRYRVSIDVPNSIDVFIGGTPNFSVGFQFSAAASCSASLQVKIPLGETGLFLEIGPEFTLHAGGLVSAGFAWKPKLTFAFFRSRTGSGNFDIHELTSQGNLEFGGSASAGADLLLKVGVSAFGRAGIAGTIGPTLTASVSQSSGSTCRMIDGSAAADLEAFAHVFFASWTFNIAHVTFWRHSFTRQCNQPPPPPPPAPPPPPPPPALTTTGSTLVYDGATAMGSQAGDLEFSQWSAATGENTEVSSSLPDSLSNYRCVVLLAPKSLEERDTNLLAAYARSGGTIVAIGEHQGFPFDEADGTLNALASLLGIGLTLDDNELDYGPQVTTSISPSSLTAGVNALADNWATSLSVSGAAQPLVGNSDGSATIVGAQALGIGQFVMAGDSNMFSDNSYGAYDFQDNGQFVRNLCP